MSHLDLRKRGSIVSFFCQARYKAREAQSHLAEERESELLKSNLWQIRSFPTPDLFFPCLKLPGFQGS